MRIFERMQGRNTVRRSVLTATAILVGCQYASEPRTAPTLALRDTTSSRRARHSRAPSWGASGRRSVAVSAVAWEASATVT